MSQVRGLGFAGLLDSIKTANGDGEIQSNVSS